MQLRFCNNQIPEQPNLAFISNFSQPGALCPFLSQIVAFFFSPNGSTRAPPPRNQPQDKLLPDHKLVFLSKALQEPLSSQVVLIYIHPNLPTVLKSSFNFTAIYPPRFAVLIKYVVPYRNAVYIPFQNCSILSIFEFAAVPCSQLCSICALSEISKTFAFQLCNIYSLLYQNLSPPKPVAFLSEVCPISGSSLPHKTQFVFFSICGVFGFTFLRGFFLPYN